MYLSNVVGPTTAPDQSTPNTRASRTGALVTADAHGRYAEGSSRGKSFFVCNSAAQALSLTGTTTYTGLVLYNKPASGVNFHLNVAAFAPTIAETGVGAVILFYQAIAASLPSLTTTNVANGALCSCLNGTTSPNASVASSCTLAANPLFLRPLIGIPWVTATAQAALLCKDEIAGELVIAPGAGVGIVAVTTAITGIGYFGWEEVPV